jgi:hypothetical protein
MLDNEDGVDGADDFEYDLDNMEKYIATNFSCRH